MKRYSSNLAFVDMLFNLLIGFTSLFIIAFLLINPTAEQGKVTPITEFIITATWDPDGVTDIDLWVRGPGPDDRFTTVGYQNKDGRYMVLERDDLGIANDVYRVNGENLLVARNIETLTINAIVPGEYVVAIHFFGPNNDKSLGLVEEVEVVDEEIVQEQMPLQVPTIKNASVLEVPNTETSSLQSKDDKKNELLKKAIQKKKENLDDSQTTLF